MEVAIAMTRPMNDDYAAAMASSPKPAGPKGQRTRRRILDAARRTFGEVGFERATIRAIADAAGVDKAAVIQYFGSKDHLFREAIDLHLETPELGSAQAVRTADAILRFALARWRGEPGDAMAALARASFTSEAAAEQLRQVVTTQAITPLADSLDDPDGRVRAALLSSFMFGMNVHRVLLGMPDLAAADEEDIVRVAAPAIAVLLGHAED